MSEEKCPSCGATIDANQTECAYCGHPIDGRSAANQSTDSESIDSNSEIVQSQPQASYQQPQYNNPQYNQYGGVPVSDKSKVAAGLLAIFLGGFGIHKFYLGKVGLGILYLLFCWTGIPAIIGFIEGIIYLASSDESFNRKYGAKY